MYQRTLRAERFAQIRDASIQFGDLTVLVGPQANGKSILLQLLKLAVDSGFEKRFPGMKSAPLVEARVCQYEQSREGHLIIDWHPRSEKVFLMGGGSGRGFKHGPAVGELAAAMVLGEKPIEPFLGITRP
jgi:glycine/D-amino acid oxidase-like deaminating enzyme